MSAYRTLTTLVGAAFLAHSAWGAPQTADASHWLRHLIPLPKQVSMRGSLALAPSEVGIHLRADAGELERAAAEELTALFLEKTGVKALTGRSFTIRIGLCDAQGRLEGQEVPGARDLAGLPNREQAYRIAPLDERTLALTALDGRGVYYASKTLQHLLGARLSPKRVEVPLAEITDWPDLAERGEWGGSANADIEWLADRKMNLVEAHSNLSVDEQGRGIASTEPTLLERARKHAVNLVPIVTHLDQLGRTRLLERYPELAGVGETARRPSLSGQAVCFSQPKAAEILADWIAALAAQPGVTDVNVWLSEFDVQCGCEACQKEGQHVVEARAAVRAWELARQRQPHVRLRILLTQGSYPRNAQILAVVPPEVGITYYDGGRTYNSSRDPMIYPLLADFAAKGRWLGCYPQLTASWRIVCPWSGPQFIRFRMQEFVAKHLKCLCGYATPNNRLYDFNVTAAAEWSWNSTGRDEREFAIAWATWRGLKAPERAAEWALLLGPVGWDVYGSGIPYPAFFGRATRLVQERRPPAWGEGMFRYFPSPAKVADDLAICQKALALAEDLEAPDLVAETRVLQGYLRMIETIAAIATTVARTEKPNAEQIAHLSQALQTLDAAATETREALQTWERTVGPGLGGSRFQDTLQVLDETVASISQVLAPLGVQDPNRAYRAQRIGAWKSEDFDVKEAITKEWDVTNRLDGAGRYEVEFRYTRGWWGLKMTRVRLFSAPKEHPEARTMVAEDAHEGVAGYQNKANRYLMDVRAHDPERRYVLVADIQGVTSRGKPENRQGCEGEVWMRKLRPR